MPLSTAIPNKLLISTLLFGILYLLALIDYNTSNNTITTTTNSKNPLYQTKSIQLSLIKDITALNTFKSSLDRTALGVTLLLHGIFSLLHLCILISIQKLSIQKLNTIETIPFLKATLFATFISIGSSIGFIISLGGKELSKQASTRVLFGKIAWVSSAFVWLQLSYSYGVLLLHQKKLRKGWRSLMFYIGDYKMIPVCSYGIAGMLGLMAVLSVGKMGHWSEPAMAGCIIGDVAALHRTWLLLRQEKEEEKKNEDKNKRE